MSLSISANTQAILLLTAPLATGNNGASKADLLTHSEYRRFANALREREQAPSDLLTSDSSKLLKDLDGVIPADRIQRLLERAFQISQAVERWRSRAIWVISRADSEYPKRIKSRLKDDSPALLYGCGELNILDSGGLAIVGSRHVDQTLVDYAVEVGRRCAQARRKVVSGGAPGIDRAAMSGALSSGGKAAAVISDSLERAALNRENRNWLLDEQLVLVSPYDPLAGFNVGHAMQRNKLIYALADAALVVNADYEKGGTWAGAAEQLQKLRFVPVYVRSTGEIGDGLLGLMRLGAMAWPNPEIPDEIQTLLSLSAANSDSPQSQLSLSASPFEPELQVTASDSRVTNEPATSLPMELDSSDSSSSLNTEHDRGKSGIAEPAEALLMLVRELLIPVLDRPKTETEIAEVFKISSAQARLWLNRLVNEGMLEKTKKPVRFSLRRAALFSAKLS